MKTIKNKIQELNLPILSRKWNRVDVNKFNKSEISEINKNNCFDLFKQNMTVNNVCNELGLSTSCVYKHHKEFVSKNLKY